MARVANVQTYVLKLLNPSSTYLSEVPGDEHEDPGYKVHAPWRSIYSDRFETMLVRVTADDGTEGWGEALAPVGPEIAAAVVDRLLAGWLKGRELKGAKPLWYGMRDLMRERGHLVGHQADALAAVDMALWDLHGKLAGLSVTDLLGGAHRESVPAYVSGLKRPTNAERATYAAELAAHGATTVKLALGEGVEADLAAYDAVAEAAPSLKIGIDAHWVYSIGEALELGRELDRRGALFFEAPLAPEDVAGHTELVSRVTVPVAVGEALRNRYEFADWIGRRALRLAQPDVARTGITEAVSIAELASCHHVPIACHHSVGLGVALAAGIHVSAVGVDVPFFEYQPTTVPVAQSILRSPLVAGPAGFAVPTGPGLGVEVDADQITALSKEN